MEAGYMCTPQEELSEFNLCSAISQQKLAHVE